MKGIILAGGLGTRLYPINQVGSKQLLNIYDKPMIYYPLSLLMLGLIKDILIISTPRDLQRFKNLLGHGDSLGISIQYQQQIEPRGVPEAFILGEDFIGNDDVCLILGDNLFYGDIHFFRNALLQQQKKENQKSARVFAYTVADPRSYGVIKIDKTTHEVVSIIEKPERPESNYAIPGLYIFDKSVARRAKELKPSKRGETEIVDLISTYLEEKKLAVEIIRRGVAWLDTGTPKSILEATQFISAIEERQGLKIGCLEEVALRMGFIGLEKFKSVYQGMPASQYRSYLEKIYLEFT